MDSPDPDTRSSVTTPNILSVVKDTSTVVALAPTGECQANQASTEPLVELAAEQLRLSPTNPSFNPAIFILPVEIVAEIFALYVVEIYNAQDYDMSSKRRRAGPLRLAAVCRMWREIALTTPHLWTTMNIFVSSLPKIPLLAELVGHWMSRSGQLTLNISISVSVAIIEEVKVANHWNDILPLFNAIRGSSPRWRKLELGIPAELYEDFPGPVTAAPLLEDLRITPLGGQQRTYKDAFRLDSAPHLRLVELSDVYVDQIIIPWQNLTSIQTHSIFIDEMLEILKCADQLLSARFSGIYGDGGIFPLPKKPLTHRSLRHLDLRREGTNRGRHLHEFLENVILPSLTSVGYHPENRFIVNSFLSLFRRSQCIITDFEIVIPEGTAPDVTEAELIRLLEGVPTVTRLSISLLEPEHREIVTDYFLECIAEVLHLEVLNFVGWRAFSWKAIAGMLTFKNYCVELQVVNIRSNRNKDENTDTIPLIDKPTVSRLLCLRNPQINVKILDNITGMDIIAGSLAFHGLSPES